MYVAKRMVGVISFLGILHFNSCNQKLLLMKLKCLLQRSIYTFGGTSSANDDFHLYIGLL